MAEPAGEWRNLQCSTDTRLHLGDMSLKGKGTRKSRERDRDKGRGVEEKRREDRGRELFPVFQGGRADVLAKRITRDMVLI